MRYVVFAAVLGTWVGLLPVAPSWVWGQSALQEKIEKEKHTLERLKRDIRKTRKQRDRSQKKRDAVLQSIEDLDRRYHKEQRDKAAITRDVRRIEQELEKIDAQETALQSQMGDRKTMIATRLRRLYMDGRAGWFRPLLTVDSYAQFVRRLLYLSVLVTRERQLFEQHQRDLAEFERLREQQANARQVKLEKEERIDGKLHVMKGIRTKKRKVLTSLQRKTQSLDDALSTLQRAENRKESLLRELEQRGGAVRPSATFRKGTLVWPAEGDLVGTFGRQRHPTFDTYVDRKGIEIATREGSAIRAASGGTVVYADWLKGYGLVVILDHGNNYFTLYAHASQLSVEEGDVVDKGGVLGGTGAFGLTDKTILYFELRKGTRPMDPVGWFAKR